MKRGRDPRADDPSLPLFDLPLRSGAEAEEPDAVQPEGDDREAGAPAPPKQEQEAATRSALFAAADAAADADGAGGGEPYDAEDDAAVTFGARLAAGTADLVAILLAVALAGFGARVLGVPVAAGDWPTFALLALSFSFLYTVIPLAFWGQTPGMAWSGLEARAADDQPLTFTQTSLRWLAGVLTVLLAGLPLLLALTGASLGDRLSGSVTDLAGPEP